MTKKLDHQAHNNFQISLRSLKFSKIIRKSYKKKQFVFKTKILNFAIPVQKKKTDPLPTPRSYGTGETDLSFHAFTYCVCSFSSLLKIFRKYAY